MQVEIAAPSKESEITDLFQYHNIDSTLADHSKLETMSNNLLQNVAEINEILFFISHAGMLQFVNKLLKPKKLNFVDIAQANLFLW